MVWGKLALQMPIPYISHICFDAICLIPLVGLLMYIYASTTAIRLAIRLHNDSWHYRPIISTRADFFIINTLQNNFHSGVTSHRHIHCLFNTLFKLKLTKTSKLSVAGPLCGEFNVSATDFPTLKVINTENVSMVWHNHYHKFKLIPCAFTENIPLQLSFTRPPRYRSR